MDLKAAKSELAADVVEPLAVTFGELPFRALLQAANGDDNDTHGAQTNMRAST